MKLNRPIPILLSKCREIFRITNIDFFDESTSSPLVQLIVKTTSDGKLDSANNRGLFVVSFLFILVATHSGKWQVDKYPCLVIASTGNFVHSFFQLVRTCKKKNGCWYWAMIKGGKIQEVLVKTIFVQYIWSSKWALPTLLLVGFNIEYIMYQLWNAFAYIAAQQPNLK